MYRPWNLFNHVPRPGPSNPPQEDAQPNEARVNKRQERPPTVQSTVPPRRVTNRGGQRGRGRGRGGGGAPENSLVHVYKAERGRARGRGAAAGRGAASSRGGHGDGQGSGSAAGPSNSGAPPAAAQSVHPLPLRPLAPFPAAPLQSAQVGSQASSLSFPLSNPHYGPTTFSTPTQLSPVANLPYQATSSGSQAMQFPILRFRTSTQGSNSAAPPGGAMLPRRKLRPNPVANNPPSTTASPLSPSRVFDSLPEHAVPHMSQYPQPTPQGRKEVMANAPAAASISQDAPSHQLIEPVPRPLSPPASHEPPLKRRRVGFRQSSPPPPVQSPLTPPRSSADATVVGEPHVKQERTPSPVYVPEAKLTTSGTIRFDTLPLECQKSTLGYQAARNKWAEREARKVRARGLIVKRMFVREDGLVIDWESAKPVMSDTLEPDPADGNAVMERAYLANDAALKEVRRVKKMAQAGLQADAPMPPPALARAAEYDRRRSSEEAVELLTSMSPLAARSPTPDMPTPHSGLQPAESTTLAKCPLRSAEREPSSMRESILATPEKMSPGRLPQLMPSPPSPSLKVPEALAHARHSPGVGRDDVAPASPQRTPSRSMSRLLQPANPSTPGSATADLIHRRYVEAQLGSQAVRDDGDLAVEAADDLPGVTEAVDDAKVDIGMAGVVKVEVDDVVKVEADDVVKVEVDDVVKVEVDDVPEDDLYLDEGSLEYPEEVSFERYDADDETGIGAAVEVAMPSPEEVDRLADVAQLFLKNYIEAFDSEREGLSSAYSSDALFSCHWPPGTRRHPQRAEGPTQGRDGIVARLRDLGHVVFNYAEGLDSEWNFSYISPAVGMLLVFHAGMQDADTRALTHTTSSFVLQRNVDRDSPWPLVAVSHQMILRDLA